MKLIPCDKKAIATVKEVRTDNFKLLWDFVESGEACAQVEGYPHKSANSCATSLRTAIRNYKLVTIAVVVRRGNVYLIKKDIEKKK